MVAVTFTPPLHLKLLLAGNFGEPRPHHLHGGLDIKTEGVEGKPVYSVGEGYIERVSVTERGYGLAVYVRHPEGFVSVYGHLQSFMPDVSERMNRWLEENNEEYGTVYFQPSDFPVKQDQQIAVSGNSGSSFGPHLHFEIRDGLTNQLLDPLDFIGGAFEDKTPPRANAVMIYPLYGTVEGQCVKTSFALNDSTTEQSITAWGMIGLGINADDFMEGSHNRLGVRLMELYVDDKLVFRSDINRVNMEENIQMDQWGDYEYYKKNNTWYLKLFIPQGVTMSILQTDHSGIVIIDEERLYKVEYNLTDYFGNKSRYTFTLKGKQHPTLLKNEDYYKWFLIYNKVNTIFQEEQFIHIHNKKSTTI